jgi:hypothetical protein
MAHKTLISGTAYSVSGGRELIGGTGYAKKKGRVLVNGTGYDIPFSSGIPIGTLPVGSVVKIGVNGKEYDFLVVNQGIPSNSSLYDSSCDGTWLLMNDIYVKQRFSGSFNNLYSASPIHSYLNGTFLNLLDDNIRASIRQIKIPYVSSGSRNEISSGANGLSAKAFILSCYELGWTADNNGLIPADGAKCSYFDSGIGASANEKRIARYDNTAGIWWTRSTVVYYSKYVWNVANDGGYDSNIDTSYEEGVRPAFTLPGTFPVIQNPDGTYSPAA